MNIRVGVRLDDPWEGTILEVSVEEGIQLVCSILIPVNREDENRLREKLVDLARRNA